MSTLTIPNSFSANTTIKSAAMNANFAAITAVVNGGIDSTNITTGSITVAKLNLTTGGGAALNLSTTGQQTWGTGLTTDANPRIVMVTDSGLQFGIGTTHAPDVQLKATGSNTLQLAKAGGGTGATLDMNSGTLENVTLSSFSFSPPLSVANGGTGTTLFTYGTATFAGAGSVDVADTSVTANTIIIVTVKASSALGEEFSYSLTAGTKFTLHSTNASSTAVVGFIRIL